MSEPICFSIGPFAFDIPFDVDRIWYRLGVESVDDDLSVSVDALEDGTFRAATAWGDSLESGADGATPEAAMRVALEELAEAVEEERDRLGAFALRLREGLEVGR